MRLSAKLYSISALLLIGFVPAYDAAGEEWLVDFSSGNFETTDGQKPLESWGAKVELDDLDKPAVQLSGGGRLSYPAADWNGNEIISPLKGRIAFEFWPQIGQTSYFAAFDSENIVIYARKRDSRLRVVLTLEDDTKVHLASPDPLPVESWNKIVLEWDFSKSVDQVELWIDDTLVDSASTPATQLKPSSLTSFTWGMYHWGGNPWNGRYHNLKIN